MQSTGRWSYELHWQRVWEETGGWMAQRRPERPKWFIVELPPFANGIIHLGHVRNYTMGDTVARFRRMAGFDVLYTTGFDAFGLPNETAARDARIAPGALVRRNMASMREQFRHLGYSHDPTRILSDHEPRYYRWVQWVFLALMRAGLIYRRGGPVNWCSRCGSTLADSLVEAGRCWRCGTSVDVVEMDRWFIREAALAEPLPDAPDPAGWPASILNIHRDWIGKQDGYELDFTIAGLGVAPDATKLTVFLHRSDALAEASAIGLPADHAAVATMDFASHVRPLETGLRAVSSDGGLDLPLVIVADGDCDHPGEPVPVRGPSGAAAGTVGGNSPPTGLRPALRYRLRDWDVARPRAWGTPVPIIHCDGCGPVPVPDADLPVLLPETFCSDAANPLEDMREFHETTCPACGADARRDTDTLEAYSSRWWYYLICSTPEAESIFDAPGAADWMPVDVMIGGSDQARTCFFHLRTMTVALNRLGIVSETDPVRTLLVTGMVKLDGRKMSKSAGNSVDPTELVERHGADAVRVAVLWAAAPDQDFNWRGDLVRKAAGLLRRIRLFVERRGGAFVATLQAPAAETRRTRQIRTWIGVAEQRVTDCLQRNAFHVAIDQIATLVERLAKLDAPGGTRNDASLEASLAAGAGSLVRLMAPFAPHLAEELWSRGGGETLMASQPWPSPLDGTQRRTA